MVPSLLGRGSAVEHVYTPNGDAVGLLRTRCATHDAQQTIPIVVADSERIPASASARCQPLSRCEVPRFEVPADSQAAVAQGARQVLRGPLCSGASQPMQPFLSSLRLSLQVA